MPWERIRREIVRAIAGIVGGADTADAEKLDQVFTAIAAYRAARLKADIVDDIGTMVAGGPFKGMRFLERAAEGAYIPKLLGCYEAELHPVIERIVKTPYARIVNVGCAEGYYAVGLALRMPSAEVVAYDLDDRARALCRELAQRNDLADRIDIRAECRHADLAGCADRTLILCDIEGAETDLLDPASAPALTRADLLVELHEIDGRSTGDLLIPRFRDSHAVTEIAMTARDPNDYPALADLSPTDRFFALLERMEPTRWVYLEAREIR